MTAREAIREAAVTVMEGYGSFSIESPNMNRFFKLVIAANLIICTAAISHAQSIDQLVKGWQNVPDDYRMKMFWRIFGPSMNRSETEYQLELMKNAGVGGVMTFYTYPISVDDPSKDINNEQFLSDPMLDSFRYAGEYSVKRGLRFGVAGGTGWPYGGPSVSLNDAAKRIRKITLKSASGSFQIPKLKPEERVVALFDGIKSISESELKLLPAEARPYVIVIGPTYMKVKRASLGAEGYVIDHYNLTALNHYLENVISKLIKASPKGLSSIFCDSLEVYNSNWTDDLPSEFQKRRKYDILSRLPELFDESLKGAMQVRFDFWRTLAELHEERFTKPLGEWCRKNGVKLEMEEYGTPPAPLKSYEHIDVPTGEQYEWKGFSFSRYPASGAHLAGKNKIGAEAWTWTGIPNRLADTLADLKLCSDYHFLAGINELTGVDWAYSPRNVPFPGWLPYYGPVMNQNNSLFPYFHYFVEYVNRCQFMLQQGKPVADVALYLPVEDCFAKDSMDQMPLNFRIRDHFATGPITGEFSLKNANLHHSNVIHSILQTGYDFDGIDFWSIGQKARVVGRTLQCGDCNFKYLVIHKTRSIEARAMLKINEFVMAGGYVLVTGFAPSEVRTSVDLSTEQILRAKRALKILQREPGSKNQSWHVGKGIVGFVEGEDETKIGKFFDDTFYDYPGDLNLAPASFDPRYVERSGNGKPINERNSGPEVFVKHRKLKDADIYFVANLSDQEVPVRILLFGNNMHLHRFDPVTGRITRLPYRSMYSGGPFLLDKITPKSSYFVVATPHYIPGTHKEVETTNRQISLGQNEWKVTFVGNDAPQPRSIQNLTSWTNWHACQGFSGTGIYETDFDYKSNPNSTTMLNLGKVGSAAEVILNGKIVGGVWCEPYEIDVSTAIKSGNNHVQIRVGNIMANHYIAMPTEDFSQLIKQYGMRFPDPQEKAVMKSPMDSGLIGPVFLNLKTPDQPVKPQKRR